MSFERVHADAAHKGNVHAEAAVQARAREADEGAEFGGGPLRGGGGAVAAGGVAGEFLEGEELEIGEYVNIRVLKW